MSARAWISSIVITAFLFWLVATEAGRATGVVLVIMAVIAAVIFLISRIVDGED